jgi:hypothetical protein
LFIILSLFLLPFFLALFFCLLLSSSYVFAFSLFFCCCCRFSSFSDVFSFRCLSDLPIAFLPICHLLIIRIPFFASHFPLLLLPTMADTPSFSAANLQTCSHCRPFPFVASIPLPHVDIGSATSHCSHYRPALPLHPPKRSHLANIHLHNGERRCLGLPVSLHFSDPIEFLMTPPLGLISSISSIVRVPVLVNLASPDAVSYSSVTRYLCEARFPPSKPEPHPADVQRDLNDSDQAILSALEDSLFASVRHLSRLTHLPSTIVYRRLTQSLGFVARHLR